MSGCGVVGTGQSRQVQRMQREMECQETKFLKAKDACSACSHRRCCPNTPAQVAQRHRGWLMTGILAAAAFAAASCAAAFQSAELELYPIACKESGGEGGGGEGGGRAEHSSSKTQRWVLVHYCVKGGIRRSMRCPRAAALRPCPPHLIPDKYTLTQTRACIPGAWPT